MSRISGCLAHYRRHFLCQCKCLKDYAIYPAHTMANLPWRLDWRAQDIDVKISNKRHYFYYVRVLAPHSEFLFISQHFKSKYVLISRECKKNIIFFKIYVDCHNEGKKSVWRVQDFFCWKATTFVKVYVLLIFSQRFFYRILNCKL